MSTALLVVGLIVVLITGISRLFWSRHTLMKKAKFLNEFSEKLTMLLQGRDDDGEVSTWLIANMDEMQSDLGILGVAARKPPFGNYFVQNYPVLLNVIPEIAKGDAEDADVQFLFTALTRYLGYIERTEKSTWYAYFNPFIWLREGVKFWVLSPFLLLYWFELIDESSVQKASSSLIVRLASAVITFIGLAGSIIGIINDWNEFAAWFEKVF